MAAWTVAKLRAQGLALRTLAGSLSIAWAYVALRVVHTLVQTTTNHITTRFAVFFVSSLVLFGLAFRAAMLVF